jgi:hypothetical protein
MSLIHADRVKETTTTTGTGTLSLGGTLTGYQTFVNGIGNGNQCAYLCDDGNGNWECTWGTITSGTPATLSRGTLISSSTGSRISFAAGTKTVAVVPMAELLLWPSKSAVLAETTIASATTTDLGTSLTLCVAVSGTTTITSFGTQPYALRFVRFTGALTLTHNASSLILTSGASRTTQAGDVGIYISDVSGNWREYSYTVAPSQGTWSPSVGGTATYTGTPVGTYTRVGRRVYFNCSITINAIGSGSTTTISGLPFTSTGTSKACPVGAFVSLATSVVFIAGNVTSGGNTIQFAGLTAAGVTTTFPLTVFQNATQLNVSGEYEAA